ncbi:hypothetical protein GS501_04575 [Saccharibacter sp. 17.LH.SD]|uniref:hypothetical protein n=1 Tax=Saccharibacter sp. 17.LH.SD TaxID=2689393 RepID=UPI001368B372|nr:hypothetical protein [Saccharibacter sp. 17.LH.SD]MXV44320.1 hypothetical protein [Saccharibacter sp. 17.LH.SD]
MSLSSILDNVGRTTFKLGYQISPLILTGGVAEKMGGAVPIIVYTQAVALLNGLVAGGISGKLEGYDLDSMWCHWSPMSGATLVDNSIAEYPYANQSVAANAMVVNPLTLSMQMICPPSGAGAMATKLATLQSLQVILNKHAQLGGAYIVITPGQVYTGMLLTRVSDTTPNPTAAAASQFQFDFTRPLTQKSENVQKQSTLMKKLSGGMPGLGFVGSGNPLESVFNGIGLFNG